MHVDPIIDAGNHILNVASMELCPLRFELDVLTPCHVLADEAGPSNPQCSTGAPNDVVDISDEVSLGRSSSRDSSFDDNDLEEHEELAEQRRTVERRELLE